ncbi:MAG: prepilin peptidase [Calditrichaeota bacterium]|nr:prepilin peptidase [Calditrichota bacterium]
MDFLFVFFLGNIFGSFLNVCIYRLPENLSLVKPGSFCPSCKNPVRAWQNVPIFSYVFLKGKCGNCGSRISAQYPIVELISGLITVLTYYYFGLTPVFFVYTVFIYFLIVIAFIDYKTELIYNKVLITLLVFGLIFNVFYPFMAWEAGLYGLLAGGGILFLFSLLGKILFKKEALGMGDVKLAAVAGFFLGMQNVLIAIYFGFIIALVTMVVLRIFKKAELKGKIPLGPFLAAGLIVFLFWGKLIINVYFSYVLG